MLRLHYAPRTRAVRVRWLFEELELPYELIRGELVPPSVGFSQNTPSGKYPVLEDGEQVIAESGAIVEYLAERYGEGRLAPALGDPMRARYLEWLHYCEGTAGSAMSPIIFHKRYAQDAESRGDLMEVWTGRARASLQAAEAHLSGRHHAWLYGRSGAVDRRTRRSFSRAVGLLSRAPGASSISAGGSGLASEQRRRHGPKELCAL